MLISHDDHTNTIQVYSVTVMTHVKALEAGQSSQGTSEPITPVHIITELDMVISGTMQTKQLHHMCSYTPSDI